MYSEAMFLGDVALAFGSVTLIAVVAVAWKVIKHARH